MGRVVRITANSKNELFCHSQIQEEFPENHRLNFLASNDLKEALLVDVDDNLGDDESDSYDQLLTKKFDEIENCKTIKKEDASNN